MWKATRAEDTLPSSRSARGTSVKLSTVLCESVRDLWAQAADKPFVVAMARGTLDECRYRNYMIQDYLYLTDYIYILERLCELADDATLKDFIRFVIAQTKKETTQVHVPHMRALGISEEDVARCPKACEIVDYIEYMLREAEEEGVLAGLTAQLQCSWVYAYIAQRMTAKYADEIAASPYKGWFDAYTCEDYVAANQEWIDVLDARAEGLSDGEVEKLCEVFRTCAAYENRLWDALCNV